MWQTVTRGFMRVDGDSDGRGAPTMARPGKGHLRMPAEPAGTTRPNTTRLGAAEVRRLTNILILHPVGSITHVCTGQTGVYTTKHTPNEPTTPAASAPTSSRDHEWRLPY